MNHPQRTKSGSESGSVSGGNNSEDSALVSIGNASFGFNFDSEEGLGANTNNTSSTARSDGISDQNSEFDDIGIEDRINKKRIAAPTMASTGNEDVTEKILLSVKSLERPESSKSKKRVSTEDINAALLDDNDDSLDDEDPKQYEQAPCASSKKRRKTNDRKRVERNAREKERSFRITKQINDIRDLLASGGVIVPKGTKSSVLGEAAGYIRTLQHHQYKSEM